MTVCVNRESIYILAQQENPHENVALDVFKVCLQWITVPAYSSISM